MKSLTFTAVSCLVLAASTIAQAQISDPKKAAAAASDEAESKAAPKEAAKESATADAQSGGAADSAAVDSAAVDSAAAQPASEPDAAGDESPATTDSKPAVDAKSAEPASASGSASPNDAVAPTREESDAERTKEMSSLLAESETLKKKREERITTEPEVPPDDLPFTYHQKHVDIAAGLSLIGATSSGLDPYRENPLLAEGFLRVGGTVMTAGPWAVALLGGFGGGAYSSTVRGEESHLSVLQFNLAAEARYHFHHRFYGYGRLALGPELASSRIGSEGSDLRLTQKNWAFRGEATAGVAMRVIGPSDGRERKPRVWLFLEGGYRLSSSHAQNLSTDEDDGPARPVDFDLNSLSTSGGLGSAGLLLTF